MANANKEKNLKAKQRIATLHQDLLASLFRKLPVLNEKQDAAGLNKAQFEILSDEEFVLLWSLPNIVIKVSPKCADYLEERRLLLGLKRDHNSGVYKGQEERRGRTT